MKARHSYFASTIGSKQLVGLTGLGLSLFVLIHMLGNLLIFVSPEAYNLYSNTLITNRGIYFAEAGLLLIFLVHIGMASWVSLLNIRARSSRYARFPSGPKGTSLIARTMWAQGAVILVFTVLHLITFKFGTLYEVEYDGLVVRDLHRLVIEVFQEPVYVIWYVFALLVLGFHLSHGVASSLQTFGINHPRYNPWFKKIGYAYALIVALGFIAQPLYVYLIHKG